MTPDDAPEPAPCAHWGEPGNCERPCSSCDHVCHTYAREAADCECEECTDGA